jgi:prevent-host-death family protein
MPFEVRVTSRDIRQRLVVFLRHAERGHRVVIADRGKPDVLLMPARDHGHLPTRDAVRLGGRFRAHRPMTHPRRVRCPG